MPPKDKVIDNLNWLSDRISTQTRTLGIGLLAITWGIMIGQPGDFIPTTTNYFINYIGISFFALLFILCDFLQYFFGYLDNRRVYIKMQAEGLNELGYDQNSIFFKLRTYMFWSKQILLLVACLWFLIIVFIICLTIL